MFCKHCGRELPDNAKFCNNCGLSIDSKVQTNAVSGGGGMKWADYLDRANEFSRRFVPAGLAAKFPAVMPVGFVAMYAVALVVVAAVVVVPLLGVHDLSGTYYANDFFPVDRITFDKQGNFTAVSYAGDTEIYNGKYSGNRSGEYSLRFTSGRAESGNPVTQYVASDIAKQYELLVIKQDDYTLWVQVIPKRDYWAWQGREVMFYK